MGWFCYEEHLPTEFAPTVAVGRERQHGATCVSPAYTYHTDVIAPTNESSPGAAEPSSHPPPLQGPRLKTEETPRVSRSREGSRRGEKLFGGFVKQHPARGVTGGSTQERGQAKCRGHVRNKCPLPSNKPVFLSSWPNLLAEPRRDDTHRVNGPCSRAVSHDSRQQRVPLWGCPLQTGQRSGTVQPHSRFPKPCLRPQAQLMAHQVLEQHGGALLSRAFLQC